MTDLARALASPGQPGATFAAVEALAREAIGAKLFTIMEIDHERGVVRRRHSNMPDAYPATGEKPLRDDAWSRRVLDERRIFVANTIEEIAAVFGDHELIRSLGCESCLNLPIEVGGAVIGTLNCLHEAGHYTPGRVSAARSLRQSGALALLVARAF